MALAQNGTDECEHDIKCVVVANRECQKECKHSLEETHSTPKYREKTQWRRLLHNVYKPRSEGHPCGPNPIDMERGSNICGKRKALDQILSYQIFMTPITENPNSQHMLDLKVMGKDSGL